MLKKTLTVVGLAAWMMGLSACSLWVNIPPQPKDAARHDPNQKAVRQVVSAALALMLQEQPIPDGFNLVLPEGTTNVTHAEVQQLLGALMKVRPDVPVASLPAVEVKGVRIRFDEAEVDIIRPAGAVKKDDQRRQLITVIVKWNIVDGWRATHMTPWRANPLPEQTP